MMIEMRHLRYAVAAAHHGSFRRAAQQLNLTQSSLSRKLREMEELLGVALFERSRSGVRPTAAGNELLRTAKRIVQDVDAMVAKAKATGRGEIGGLTVGFYTSLSAGNLRATLLDFARRFPRVDIRTVEGSRARLLTELECGSLDVAIITGDPGTPTARMMAVWSERIIVALPENHPLASNEIVYWPDLKGETFLLGQHDPGPDIHDLLLAKLAAPGDRPRVVQHDVSRENIKSLVSAGFGVSLMCEDCIGANYAGLVYREARDGNGPTRIGYMACWEKDNDNPALMNFLALLSERYTSPNGAVKRKQGTGH